MIDSRVEILDVCMKWFRYLFITLNKRLVAVIFYKNKTIRK